VGARHVSTRVVMHTSSPLARWFVLHASWLLAGSCVAVFASCAASGSKNPNLGGDDGGGSSSGGGNCDGSLVGCGGPLCDPMNPCNDFPANPVYDNGAPSNAGQLFGPAGSGNASGGPCLVEPQVGDANSPGALYPNNWLRPLFLLTPPSGQDLFEIRLHTAAEVHDLVVYTKSTQWKMPKDMWAAIAARVEGIPITVTVRSVSSNGGTPSTGSSGDFSIAPASAAGAMVYWTTAAFDNNANNTTLQGFHVGDEGVTTALTTQQVQQQVRAEPLDGGNLQPYATNGVFCIGCHTSTPDGLYVGFTAQWPWANALASVQADGGVGSAPPWLTKGAISNLSPNINGYYAPPTVNQVMMGIQTFSAGHYTPGDRVVVASVGAAWNSLSLQDPGKPTGVVSQLAWFDLEYTGQPPMGAPYSPWQSSQLTSPLVVAPCNGSTSGCASTTSPTGGWGVLARTGDPNSAGSPNWSHDGKTIAYSSTDVGTKDGRLDCSATPNCKSDVMLVPYGNRLGGAATPLQGASDAAFNEYYPAFSPDDQFIAYNRVPSGTSMYAQPKAEVYVVASGGSGPVRLNGNDPAACTNTTSPGVQNTWPKWAPGPSTGSDGKIYYWVTFSSSRSPLAPGKQQLYVSGIVLDPATKTIQTYPAIYLWNQDATVNNLIPAWDNFAINHGGVNQ
jgi:hypothetical protein